jgi:hypothetical protein
MVLVVIGILIALELSNASQRRMDQGRLREYVVALVRDLEADLAMLEPIQLEMKDVRKRVSLLTEYVQSHSLEELKNVDLYFLMRAPFYRPYIWNRAALDQMTSSGMLRLMQNQMLATRISQYEASQHHLEEDFRHDRVNAVNAVAAANKVVDMAYPSMETRIEPIQLKLGMPFFDFGDDFDTSLMYREFAALNKPMLQHNRVLLGEAVNAYQAIVGSYGLWPRFVLEMPMLQNFIKGLIDDLRAEYHIIDEELAKPG